VVTHFKLIWEYWTFSAFDAILGYDWLKLQSPMQCHWTEKTMEFDDNGTSVKLQGIQQLSSIAKLS